MSSRSVGSPISGTTRPERGWFSTADGRDDSFDDQVRVISRITEEASTDGVNVFERLRRPRRYGSPNEAALDLIVIDALAVVHLGQPAVDLCQEHEALDSVFERGISRKLLESCEQLAV